MPDGLVPSRRSIDGFRRLWFTPFAGLFGAALLLVAFAGSASAHGRLGAAEGRCRLFIGPDIMNFTGYLPDASKNEFCEGHYPPPAI